MTKLEQRMIRQGENDEKRMDSVRRENQAIRQLANGTGIQREREWGWGSFLYSMGTLVIGLFIVHSPLLWRFLRWW